MNGCAGATLSHIRHSVKKPSKNKFDDIYSQSLFERLTSLCLIFSFSFSPFSEHDWLSYLHACIVSCARHTRIVINWRDPPGEVTLFGMIMFTAMCSIGHIETFWLFVLVHCFWCHDQISAYKRYISLKLCLVSWLYVCFLTLFVFISAHTELFVFIIAIFPLRIWNRSLLFLSPPQAWLFF